VVIESITFFCTTFVKNVLHTYRKRYGADSAAMTILNKTSVQISKHITHPTLRKHHDRKKERKFKMNTKEQS
jgi:hypothetical protein